MRRVGARVDELRRLVELADSTPYLRLGLLACVSPESPSNVSSSPTAGPEASVLTSPDDRRTHADLGPLVRTRSGNALLRQLPAGVDGDGHAPRASLLWNPAPASR